MEEMKPNQEEIQNLSQEERRAKREAHREEMKSWAEENGIDLKDLMPVGGQGRGNME
jgi:hypothetical protein